MQSLMRKEQMWFVKSNAFLFQVLDAERPQQLLFFDVCTCSPNGTRLVDQPSKNARAEEKPQTCFNF